MPIGHPDSIGTTTDRIIREAMEAGHFDELEGRGKPIPGAGRPDDDMWWIRSWVERNRTGPDQEPSRAS
jgi:hypothetical protein